MPRRATESGEFPVAAHKVVDDGALIGAVLEGQEAAAITLWERHAKAVRVLLRRWLARDEVEEWVGEVFQRLVPSLERLREVSSLRIPILAIAIRVAEEQRARAERPRLRIESKIARLYVLLDLLDADTRSLFLLRYVEQLSLSEIGALLGLSVEQAGRSVEEAAAKVFALLESEGLGDLDR